MKERLTGAIILVALMVLLVPELLTGPLRSTPRAAALAPAAGEAPLRSYTIELADESHTRSAATQASGPRQPAPLSPTAQADNAESETPGASGGGDPGGSASASVPPATAATPAPTTPSNPGGISEGTGSATPSGQVSGSAPRARADSRRANSARAGSATPAPGGRDNGAGASGAWVVQLGSFASRANAEHLARQVRSQGFEVSVSQSSSGRHLFRVRVGAAHDRAGAAALAQKLQGLGHHGTVVPKQGGA